MKKLTLLMLVTFFIAANLNAFPPSEKQDFIGEWTFDNPNAPYNYQKGTFSIDEKDDELVGELKFSDGYKVELEDIVINEGILTFGMNIESYYITVSAKVEGEKLTGTIIIPDGEMPLEAVKVTKEEQ